MAKRTLDIFDCDICGEEGERYTVNFPDGTLAMDRCATHNKKIEALRKEKGAWTTKAGAGRSSFRVSNIEDIKRQL